MVGINFQENWEREEDFSKCLLPVEVLIYLNKHKAEKGKCEEIFCCLVDADVLKMDVFHMGKHRAEVGGPATAAMAAQQLLGSMQQLLVQNTNRDRVKCTSTMSRLLSVDSKTRQTGNVNTSSVQHFMI